MPTKVLEVPEVGTSITPAGGDAAYVLEAHQQENGNIYVLLLLPNNKITHFATGLFAGNGWMLGRYFDTVNEALSDFLERR